MHRSNGKKKSAPYLEISSSVPFTMVLVGKGFPHLGIRRKTCPPYLDLSENKTVPYISLNGRKNGAPNLKLVEEMFVHLTLVLFGKRNSLTLVLVGKVSPSP